MWYLAHAEAGAELYAGLAESTDRAHFEEALHEGRAAELIHRLAVEEGDTIFIPSGRIHAIGAGCLIVEIQQNSDTTLPRVRLEPRRPRRQAAHAARRSIAPVHGFRRRASLAAAAGPAGGGLVDCPFFRVEKWTLDGEARPALENTGGRFAIFTC